MSSPHVLIVDDDPSVRGVVQAVLETDGFTTWTVNDGADALAAIETATPDAVVLDLMMPGTSGWEVLHEVRTDARPHRRQLPIVVLTAKAAPDDVDGAQRAGASAYLAKPFEPDELITTLTRLIAESAIRPR